MENDGQSYIAVQFFEGNWSNPLGEPRLLNIVTSVSAKGMDTGPQDPRLFEWKDECWVAFNQLNEDRRSRSMYIFCVDNETERHAIKLSVDGATPRMTEKNWTPLVRDDVLHFIYMFQPLVVLRLRGEANGRCEEVYRSGDAYDTGLRGSTPAYQIDSSTWAGFVHTTRRMRHPFDPMLLPFPARKTPFVYRTHKFAIRLTGEGWKLDLSGELSFFDRQIELVYGWIPGEDSVLLNVDDRYSILTSVTAKKMATS